VDIVVRSSDCHIAARLLDVAPHNLISRPFQCRPLFVVCLLTPPADNPKMNQKGNCFAASESQPGFLVLFLIRLDWSSPCKRHLHARYDSINRILVFSVPLDTGLCFTSLSATISPPYFKFWGARWRDIVPKLIKACFLKSVPSRSFIDTYQIT
jgi:hypothetical protein